MTAVGRYDITADFQDKGHHSAILARLKEMVHGNDMEDLRSSYRQESGKTLDRSHKVSMAHVEKALNSIIDKNASESAIKIFLDLQVQNGRAVSKQADLFKEAIGDIIPETFSIKTPHACGCINCGCGVSEDIVVKAAQFKDLLAIFIVLARLPKDVNPSYQGKIRELLKPFQESMSEFSMKTFVNKLEEYEEKKPLCGQGEDKSSGQHWEREGTTHSSQAMVNMVKLHMTKNQNPTLIQ